MADMKKYTSKQIVKMLDHINESLKDWQLRAFSKAGKNLSKVKNYKVWQEGNHPILLDRSEMIPEKLDYIHYNPVEDEIVDEAEYYWFSSARNYTGKAGLLKIDLL